MCAMAKPTSHDGAASATLGRFDWPDPFLLNEQLDEDERLIHETARDYAQDKLQPRILEANRHERFDREILREMGALACWAPPSPRNMAVPAPPMSPMA